jgi:uncharacterized membrane protein
MDAVPTLARSFALGFVCGLRSLSGPTALAYNEGRRECPGCAPAPLRLMRSDLGRLGFGAAALGELVFDKSPLAPDRTAPGALGGRIVFGALSGFLATRSTSAGRSSFAALVGAVLGGVGAALGSFAGRDARRAATSGAGLPDLPVALVEDTVAHAIATFAARA